MKAPMTRARLLTFPTAAVAALLLAACGGSADDRGDSGIPSASAPASESVTATTEVEGVEAPAGEGEAAASSGSAEELPEGPKLPDVSVKDLAGGSLSVADIKSDKPVLVWFYAPHCPYCNEEAPKVEAFAKANADKLTVVGLGTQDDEQQAKDFVAEHGLKTPRMLYDESFASWQQLGIRSQPGAMIFDSNGVSRYTWVGAFDEQEALEVAKRLS